MSRLHGWGMGCLCEEFEENQLLVTTTLSSILLSCMQNNVILINVIMRYHSSELTHWPLRDMAVILEARFFNSIYRAWAFAATLLQVMAWCRQATSHHLSQCLPTTTCVCQHMASLSHNDLSYVCCQSSHWGFEICWTEFSFKEFQTWFMKNNFLHWK